MAFAPAIMAGVQAVGTAASAASGALSLIGTGVSAFATYKQGQAAKAQANYQAGVARSNAMQGQFDARVNAQSAEVMAKEAQMEGAEAQRRSATQSRRKMAQFTAQQSRLGLDLGSQSFNDSLGNLTQLLGSEQTDIAYSTAGKTRSARFNINQSLHAGQRSLSLGANRSKLLIASGKNQARSATLGAIGTGIAGVAKWGAEYGQ